MYHMSESGCHRQEVFLVSARQARDEDVFVEIWSDNKWLMVKQDAHIRTQAHERITSNRTPLGVYAWRSTHAHTDVQHEYVCVMGLDRVLLHIHMSSMLTKMCECTMTMSMSWDETELHCTDTEKHVCEKCTQDAHLSSCNNIQIMRNVREACRTWLICNWVIRGDYKRSWGSSAKHSWHFSFKVWTSINNQVVISPWHKRIVVVLWDS